MTDPTRSNTFAEQRGPTLRLNYPLADGAQSYAGQFASVNSHAAAADQGQYTPYAALAGQILAGQFSDEALGDACTRRVDRVQKYELGPTYLPKKQKLKLR